VLEINKTCWRSSPAHDVLCSSSARVPRLMASVSLTVVVGGAVVPGCLGIARHCHAILVALCSVLCLGLVVPGGGALSPPSGMLHNDERECGGVYTPYRQTGWLTRPLVGAY
jgi:hypothetical protein